MSTLIRLKQQVLQVLRSIGLLRGAERLHLHWTAARTKNDNARFCHEHPGFLPPPSAAMHDAYGSVSFRSYWEGGQRGARALAKLILSHQPKPERILEWGCGPARILGHLPGMLLDSTQFFGTDYNKESISWCRRAIGNITFSENQLSPPLSFVEKHFDVIYAVSVLTHLSVSQQDAWINELRRVLPPNGCLIVTTHGEQSAKLLLPHEYARFRDEGVVVRSGVEEGKRCFLSYHNPSYARKHLFADFQICERIPGDSPTAAALWGVTGVEQDTWIVR